jgi:lysocardiolipin and lysophospholipid acyltransferase
MFKALKWLRGITVFFGLCILLLSINVLQIFSLLFLVFGKQPFMVASIWIKAFFGAAASLGAKLCGNTIEVTGDQLQAENAILMANHQTFLDPLIVWMLTSDVGTAGWINWFAKDSLKYIPGVGVGLKLSHAIFLKRNWTKDAGSIKATFQSLLDAKVPFLITIFPEGTRMKPSKHAASRDYAMRKGGPVYERVLMPRPKGVWATVQGMYSSLSAVYDLSIGFPCSVPPPLKFFTQGGYNVQVHISRFSKEDLPKDERGFNQWIQDRFLAKDLWMKEHSGADVP